MSWDQMMPAITRGAYTPLNQQAASWLGRNAKSLWEGATSSPGRSILTGAGLGAMALGLGRAATTTDEDEAQGHSRFGRGMLGSLLGAGLGAAGVYGAQRWLAPPGADGQMEWPNWLNQLREHNPFAKQATAAASLQQQVDMAPIPEQQRQMYQSLIQQLPDQDQQQLQQRLSSAAGATVAYLLARFFGAKGLMPQVGAGILGALAGGHMTPHPHLNFNPMGQLTTDNFS